jgi:hypothetical protein
VQSWALPAPVVGLATLCPFSVGTRLIPSRYSSQINSFMEKSDMVDKNADRKGLNGLIILVGIAIARSSRSPRC